ncbi:polysaccharide biosynthesis tyrosine autokinase [Simonsiella muelleri]|uniref:Putative tyrosine-protein kinase EpsB n=1 Tax=Simonsiella muelleri ATCC 29453 TaxID=641147 RepID=V9HLZ0_9NEIS|nr:polysaccharide biosynthesis tyrosine autokinase [Simonsiella muelleri]AUX61548.1 capsular biosynthesis protein [Simonsiella muelleri ATCC 29453]EFG30778.1 capsular exopolysaccharide family protein [Simonsiella muelleri ATCC 29453]UBQ53609.1 polysaccharide biosynthesis tyrosine autokinase [Simonsiella muelleri]
MVQTHSSQQNHQTIDDDEIDLTQLFGTLWFHKWKIIIVTVLCTLVGVLVALGSTPVYQADAMVEVTGTKNQILGELGDLLGGTPQAPTDTEIELIKSRLVLGKSVSDLGLDLVAKPEISFFNKVLGDKTDVQPEINVESFTVDALWLNREFELTYQGNQQFRIKTPEEKTFAGVIGQPLQINAETRLLVKKITAPVGQKFTLTKFTQLSTIEHLRKNLSVAAKGKNVPILSLSLTGTEPLQIQTTLAKIIENYMVQNREKEVQTARSGLDFINSELPRLSSVLEDAENKLNAYRARSGSLDVPAEAKSTLESLNKIEMQIVDLRTEESVLSGVYTHEHPAYKALEDKLKVLQQAKERLNKQISRMPETQQEIIRLTRDVDINQAIYVQLLNKQQELNILRASSQGNVRLIDQAITAEEPIKPKKKIIVLLAMMVGLFLSCGYYLIQSLMKQGISSEDEIEAMGLEVLSSVPLSDLQNKRDKFFRKNNKNKDIRSNSLLAIKDPTDPTIEALRALRTTLHFRSLDAKNKVVMISGAAPEVGKSFISANLAVLMAQAGRKILLIDGDMRKGYLHYLMQLPEKKQGLSNILQNDKLNKNNPYDNYIQTTMVEGLDFVSLGTDVPKNPSELLLNNKLSVFLKWAEKHYDHIILDTPPVLAVTDAAVIGQYVGTTLLVTQFGKTDSRELATCAARFSVNHVKIDGVVLNGIQRTEKNYYSYGNYANKYAKK